MATGPREDAPILEQKRLERAINWARWSGAAITFGLGPLFPNLGMPYVVALGLFLLLYGVAARSLADRIITPDDHRRVSVVSAVADHAVVIYAMFVFSRDPGWTTFFIGVLVIIASAFRFGSSGALLSTVALSLAYLGIAVFRQVELGYAIEAHRAAFHVAVYALTGLLMAGILREFHALRSQREALLREASQLQALHEADRLKREFVAAVTHDLRTPLTVVRGALELLLGGRPGPLTAGQRDLAESASRGARRLEEFTEELMEMAQLEEGRIALEEEAVDPAALLREVIADHELLARQKDQRVALSVDGTPNSVIADPRRLRQVVGNLLGNAIRYAPRGSTVEILAARLDGTLTVRVRDHGAGISLDERGRVFDPFFRGRGAHGTAGSGLGLAVARSLAALHGGTLEYEETPGGGSTFLLTLPSE